MTAFLVGVVFGAVGSVVLEVVAAKKKPGWLDKVVGWLK
jgi:hypothetical protein